ncbi:hypothetical protein N5C10_11615 [Acinetobacter johnsonii]|uniref:Uncharacterized protein n=1 Tax=Acinetobacter johnsonii TaxID=40214 RepID=A0AA42SPS4_ACIJO|nr:hypothetical protein [Acinetobacter johnsonii]MDH0969873.1 hypothetical protein [Acinetobacter johnsonii]
MCNKAESQQNQRNSNNANPQDYTKHYVYEPNSFVPLLQTGYAGFIQLIETPDYRQFQNVPYSIYKDPVWKTETALLHKPICKGFFSDIIFK